MLRLRLDRLGAGGSQLRFSAASNHSYSLRLRTDVSSPSWNTLSNVVAGVADREVVIEDGYPSVATRYYQVVTPAQPDTRASGPTLIRSPVDLTVRPGGLAEFSVVAVGQGIVRYQWYYENTLISGATASTDRKSVV